MTPEERDLRRALDARSGEVSPEFRVRLGLAFNEGRPASGLMQGVAVVAVVAITLGTVGALVMSRSARNVAHQGPASSSRLASPTASPVSMAPTAQLSAPSGDVLWAFVGGLKFYRSLDRGDTWELRSIEPAQYPGVQDISFIDAQQGWYFVSPGEQYQCKGYETQIWRTDDGAANWQKMSVEGWFSSYKSEGSWGDQCKGGLTFIDSMHGFIGGWAAGRHATIYRTEDGGRNWRGVDLPDPPDFKTGPGFSLRPGSVKRFGNALYVIAWGEPGGDIPERQYVFRSTDGGGTWTWLTKLPSQYIVMVTESRWLQLSVPGQSMESTNTGKQWHRYATDFNPDGPVGRHQVAFADSRLGYAGGRGELQRTVDGGSHWITIANLGRLVPPTPVVDGSCTDQASGPKTAPLGDNFGVTVQVPNGWKSIPIGLTETKILLLNPPSTYSNQPTTIVLQSFIGFNTSPIEEVAAYFYGVGSAGRGNPPKQVLGQVSRCVVGGDTAVFFNYTQGKQGGYLVLFIHHHNLYGLTLEGAGGVDERAWQDAKKILGSWTWTASYAPIISSCSDQPTGPASAPLGDQFKVVVQFPTGWTATIPIEGHETKLLVLDAPPSYSNQPTKIELHSLIGYYPSETTLQEIAAQWYGPSGMKPARQLAGQVTTCWAGGGDPGVFFNYTEGDHVGYLVLFLHYHFLYALELDGVGGVDPRAWQDAKRVLGSWTWTVTTDPRCPNGSASGWRTYASAKSGYSVDYPAGWCDLGSAGAPDSEQYFSNEKWNVPMFDLSSSGIGLILSVVSGACPAAPPAERVDGQSVLKVNGQDVTRTYGFGSNSHGSYWVIRAAVTNGKNCLRFQFLTRTQSARDSNLTIADRIIASVRFS
jgi:photosystem II stability/assembly factor-like uncharacterized protein